MRKWIHVRDGLPAVGKWVSCKAYFDWTPKAKLTKHGWFEDEQGHGVACKYWKYL